MIQCFVKKEYAAPFGLLCMPRLFSVSRTDEKASAHPRVMHAHDDLVEVVLVRGGESRYYVGGTPYDARRGDLFIFNSRVVHDEPSGPDRPVATVSLALGGLAVPGLRANALIAEDASPVCHLNETQTARLERLYDVLYDELTAGNDDGAHHLLMAVLSLVQQFRAAAADGRGGEVPRVQPLFARLVAQKVQPGRALFQLFPHGHHQREMIRGLVFDLAHAFLPLSLQIGQRGRPPSV